MFDQQHRLTGRERADQVAHRDAGGICQARQRLVEQQLAVGRECHGDVEQALLDLREVG